VKVYILIDAIDVTGEKKMGMHCNEKALTLWWVRWRYLITQIFYGFRMATTNVCLYDNCFLK